MKLSMAHSKTAVVILAVLLIAGGILTPAIAGSTTVTIDDTDAQRPDDNDSDGQGESYGNNDFLIIGFFNNGGVEHMHVVWVFQMTGASNGMQILDADFQVTQTGSGNGTWTYDLDAHVIRTNSSSTILVSDYETSALWLMDDFDGGSPGASGLKSLDIDGKSALTSYLQDNWSEGDYVFVGLKTDPLTFGSLTATDYFNFGGVSTCDAQLILEVNPDITELDINYADLQRIQEQDADGMGDWVGGSPANNLVGYYEQSNVGNMHTVWSFQMQGFGDGDRIANADFIVDQTGQGGGTYTYDIDAHVIRTASSSGIVASDYEDSAEPLMDNFNGTAAGTKSLDGAGKAALTSYLQNNWSRDNYVVIGLKTDPLTLASFPGGSNDFYQYATGGTLRIGLLPPQGTVVMVR